jgi:hypothetical protein
VLKLARGAALAVGVAAGCSDPVVADPAPGDAGMDGIVADPPPRDAGMDIVVADPPPPDAGMDVLVADPPPPDAGVDGGSSDATVDIPVADPAPGDAGHARLELIDQWRDSGPRRAPKRADLPLHDPPDVRLVASAVGDTYAVRIEGLGAAVSMRWESAGRIEGDGDTVIWSPADPDDQIRVAVRSLGGVSVVSIRAKQLPKA